MRMRWRDVLFAHWPVPANVLRPLIPKPLELDTFDGWAWLGLTPLRMEDVRPRLAPRALALDFLELNVRTYVSAGGQGGVWFFSLDASSRLAVWTARAGFGLPYFHAHLDARSEHDSVCFSSSRIHGGAAPADLDVRYRPVGDVYHSGPESFDHWLIERYRLYVVGPRGRVSFGDIHHLPWPLQSAEAEFPTLQMTEQLGFRLPGQDPVLHYAERLDVVAWRVKALA